MSKANRKMRLCTFWFPPGSHSAGWRMPDAIPGSESSFKIMTHIAQLSEQGKMDAIFFADSVTSQPVDLIARRDKRGEQVHRGAGLEPMSLVTALAAVTSKIGLIATGTTTYNHPYHIARRFATLDQISGGRGGWNLVTSQTESEAQNFGFDVHMEHDARYDRASEFYDVVAGLWDSWEDGAMLEDKENARYFDIDKAHLLNHEGEHFKVRGPLNVLRSPQGRPIVVQAGASGPGKALAARIADCVFTAQSKFPEAKAFYDEVKGLATGYGRHPEDLKVMPGLLPIIGRTMAEAEELRDQLQSLITDDQALRSLYRIAGGLDLTKLPLDGPMPELPLSNGAQGRQKILMDMARKENLTLRQAARRFAVGQAHQLICGTPETIADMMQDWFEKGACDGFCMMPCYYPRGIEAIVHLLIPELQRRGLFRTEYEGATLRENLGLPMPQNRYTAVKAGGKQSVA
jgi:FMN-dependent oxidoreductase (nitrilotriacetate monooxygenase family)